MYKHTFYYYLNPTTDSNQHKRYFRPITFVNGFRLSIQMSTAHHCTPRKLLPITEYTQVEISFSYKELPFVFAGGGAVSPLIAQRLENFREGIAYHYVPIKLVQEVFDYMAKTHKLNLKQFRI